MVSNTNLLDNLIELMLFFSTYYPVKFFSLFMLNPHPHFSSTLPIGIKISINLNLQINWSFLRYIFTMSMFLISRQPWHLICIIWPKTPQSWPTHSWYDSVQLIHFEYGYTLVLRIACEPRINKEFKCTIFNVFEISHTLDIVSLLFGIIKNICS